jgi:hypothetical protein
MAQPFKSSVLMQNTHIGPGPLLFCSDYFLLRLDSVLLRSSPLLLCHELLFLYDKAVSTRHVVHEYSGAYLVVS